MDLFAQTHLPQRFFRTLAPFVAGHPGDGKRDLHVGEDALLRDQIVTLEHEADRVVAVGVPVPIRIFFRGNPVNDQVAFIITIQSADDV